MSSSDTPAMSDSDAQPPEEGGIAHRSVLLQESLDVLALQPGATVADCTVGAGGHSAAFIERIGPGGRLIGLDVDPAAFALARPRLEPLAQAGQVRLDLVQANFGTLGETLAALQPPALPVQAIFADLGVSSMQFDQAERGFSFRSDHPLDMRMDPALPQTAADILRQSTQDELADIFFHLGGERGARRIARFIVEIRRDEPIETTGQLEALVRRALRVRGHWRIHPATKTFQALRIAVNREMEVLKAFLESAPELLAPGGVLAIISFHSLEDRQVKHRFKDLVSTSRFQQIVRLVRPGEEETAANPRSRSALLRAIRRI